jgi:hypothetical protein
MDDMDLLLAETLVRDALSTVLPEIPLLDGNATLVDIGLSTSEERLRFNRVLVARVEEEGYQIDPVYIQCRPDDTPRIVAQILPGHSTKGNTI